VSRVPELGRRGEGWVVAQSVLFVAIGLARFAGVGWPSTARPILLVAGIVLAVAGVALFVAARVALGRSFTPLPRPRVRSEFRGGGPYRFVRHPVYVAVVLIAIGWALARAPIAFVPTALLAVLFDLKARREEAWLLERYPEYAGYRRGTPRRFIPRLY
jgi:protein-S-isoprenylcysteine O-methyltransferase Ste14